LHSILFLLSLWSPDVERDLIRKVGEKCFTTIECTATTCGKFKERAVFSEHSKCPHCGGKLRVKVAQSRNVPVSTFTEKYAREVMQAAIDKSYKGSLFVVRGARCPELSLTGGSAADLAIVRRKLQSAFKAEDIVVVMEVKMSLVWNWKPGEDKPSADFFQHNGRPSLSRTDSLLKAIGKGAIFRSTEKSRRIPYLVIGNCPPPQGYYAKLDGAVRSGLVQKFISLTPKPVLSGSPVRNPKQTRGGGFLRIDSMDELSDLLKQIIDGQGVYIGRMVDRKELGEKIKALDTDRPSEAVADRFIEALLK